MDIDSVRSLSNSSTDEDLCAIIQMFRASPVDGEAVAELALALARSGRIEKFSTNAADVASTGGPTSLTTLLCPLFLVTAGYDVPKLTVRGRPAGGIDVLQTITGYRANPTPSEVRLWLAECGYVHMVATGEWAPLDGRLFKLRQAIGAQNVRPLVIASILSKKIAVGLMTTAVEIRRGPFGNLGDDEVELGAAQHLFHEVASILGFQCTAVITGDGSPYQPFIGRGEALVALNEIFIGEAGPALQRHLDLCRRLSGSCVGRPLAPSVEQLRDAFEKNLIAQGSSYSAFLERIAVIAGAERHEMLADSAGHLSWELGRVRDIIGHGQGVDEGDVPGDGAGVVLHRLGGTVEVGDSIASVRGPQALSAALATAARVLPVGTPPTVLSDGESM